MFIGVDNITKLDDVGMMNSLQDRDFSVNLIHPRLRIHTLFPNQFNGDLGRKVNKAQARLEAR